MKNLQLIFCILGAGLLAACTNTWQGVKADVHDTSEWAHYRPSAMERMVGPAPVGYATRKPAEMMEDPTWVATSTGVYPVAQTTYTSGGLVWHNIGNYSARNPALLAESGGYEPTYLSPQRSSAATPLKYNTNVNVFPVDGDFEPYSQLEPGWIDAGGRRSGEMAQQIFFGYGSAKVGNVDRRNLHELAESLANSERPYGLSVIGHASKRVDNVRDPIQKKMINFEMAQKRANAVTAELRTGGANPHWITATSQGDKEPNPRRGDKTQEAADRRAEVYMDDNRYSGY